MLGLWFRGLKWTSQNGNFCILNLLRHLWMTHVFVNNNAINQLSRTALTAISAKLRLHLFTLKAEFTTSKHAYWRALQQKAVWWNHFGNEDVQLQSWMPFHIPQQFELDEYHVLTTFQLVQEVLQPGRQLQLFHHQSHNPDFGTILP
nr:hypothetical protein Iba_chr15aCG13110 [Ipomoea batatas]